jgi:DNA-binding protein H-NS
MGNVTLTLEEYEALRRLIGSERESEGAEEAAAPKKKKRKVSKYQKQFGKEMKKLKAAHPRTKVTQLMSRGHSAARKSLGMKRRSK